MTRKKRNILGLKLGWWIVVIVVFLWGRSILFSDTFTINDEIVIDKGDSMQQFYTLIPTTVDRYKLRRYIRNNADDLKPLEPGKYVFSGSYTPVSLISHINTGPQKDYERVTILEGWSIYDIDDFLVKKGYSEPGAYVRYVTDASVISRVRTQFEFVDTFFETQPSASRVMSLEGLLYPDTYHLNPAQDVIPQLVTIQLRTFDKRVWTPYKSEILSFSDLLQRQGFSFGLGRYNIVNLVSIIQKEERTLANKPTIAGLFLNRIQNNMRIDADITLCYGLKQGYENCPPRVIVQNLRDENNLYNTRVHNGFTPSPIANPAVSTFESVLRFQKTSYLYYLHDSQGKIWYAETLDGHNANKRQHL